MLHKSCWRLLAQKILMKVEHTKSNRDDDDENRLEPTPPALYVARQSQPASQPAHVSRMNQSTNQNILFGTTEKIIWEYKKAKEKISTFSNFDTTRFIVFDDVRVPFSSPHSLLIAHILKSFSH
jgi:hypothetical protein